MHITEKQINASHLGTIRESAVVPVYIDWLATHFEHLKGMSISAVIDCGNGAAGTVLPELVAAMRWSNVQLLYPELMEIIRIMKLTRPMNLTWLMLNKSLQRRTYQLVWGLMVIVTVWHQ